MSPSLLLRFQAHSGLSALRFPMRNLIALTWHRHVVCRPILARAFKQPQGSGSTSANAQRDRQHLQQHVEHGLMGRKYSQFETTWHRPAQQYIRLFSANDIQHMSCMAIFPHPSKCSCSGSRPACDSKQHLWPAQLPP